MRLRRLDLVRGVTVEAGTFAWYIEFISNGNFARNVSNGRADASAVMREIGRAQVWVYRKNRACLNMRNEPIKVMKNRIYLYREQLPTIKPYILHINYILHITYYTIHVN